MTPLHDLRRLLTAVCLLLIPRPAAAAELAEQIDAIFAEVDRGDSPGCALGVVRDGELVYGRGYGLASLEHGVPITTSTVFRTGSVSKQFTALAVLLAEAEGKLALGDDIRRYLPELAEQARPITIAHLIHHTSGLRDYLDLMVLAGVPEEAHYTNAEVMAVLSRQQSLNFPPGEEYLYSNSGYFLLSQILERATGKSLRDWAAEKIFGPLGMERTHFHDDPWMVVPGRAFGYGRRGEDEEGFHTNMTTLEMVGDGGVFTTIDDLVRWERNTLEPKLDRTVMARMLETGELADGTAETYAAGLVLGSHRGLPVIRHGGGFVGFRAGMQRFPSERLAVYCLCNLAQAEPMGWAERVAELYLAGRLAPPEPGPEPVPAAELVHLVGTWADRRSFRVLQLSVDEGGLRASFGGSPWRIARAPAGASTLGYVLFADGWRQQLAVERTDGGWQLTISREGRRPMVFERVETVAPSAAELAAYAGRYRSEELGVTWEVVQGEDGGLVLRLPPHEDAPLEPRYRDAFSWPWGHAVFERSGDGTVSAMRLGTGRARNLLLPRIEFSPAP